MAVIYGWAYAVFHANVGWDKGAATEYDYWENFWANAVDSYIFDDGDDAPLIDTGDMLDVATIINRLLVEVNIFLKGDATQGGFITQPVTFPKFKGNPEDNNGLGSGDFIILNKLKKKYSTVDSDMIWSIQGDYMGHEFGGGRGILR